MKTGRPQSQAAAGARPILTLENACRPARAYERFARTPSSTTGATSPRKYFHCAGACESPALVCSARRVCVHIVWSFASVIEDNACVSVKWPFVVNRSCRAQVSCKNEYKKSKARCGGFCERRALSRRLSERLASGKMLAVNKTNKESAVVLVQSGRARCIVRYYAIAHYLYRATNASRLLHCFFVICYFPTVESYVVSTLKTTAEHRPQLTISGRTDISGSSPACPYYKSLDIIRKINRSCRAQVSCKNEYKKSKARCGGFCERRALSRRLSERLASVNRSCRAQVSCKNEYKKSKARCGGFCEQRALSRRLSERLASATISLYNESPILFTTQRSTLDDVDQHHMFSPDHQLWQNGTVQCVCVKRAAARRAPPDVFKRNSAFQIIHTQTHVLVWRVISDRAGCMKRQLLLRFINV
ncbi:hypothetical protein O3G_MSEX010469 [Manduca sexta]|uniref:Uncharacterized protein n=1 Tax=Manduca sexta TaxID=7130 RepID=A0A921ZGT5_MANSE|nr:hypothetical protein O3G_MSEX010469 [Manduca sexta]